MVLWVLGTSPIIPTRVVEVLPRKTDLNIAEPKPVTKIENIPMNLNLLPVLILLTSKIDS